MGSLSTAEVAIHKGFFSSVRGGRKLTVYVADTMVDYFKVRGTPLRELCITPPSLAAQEDWEQEWREYAESAGLTDVAEKNNVVR